jgi:pyruvate/2-oxoglutarate dehydrogenase complex dihydrolipoamide acyltransferase (E2) component
MAKAKELAGVVEASRAEAGRRTWFTPVVRSMARSQGLSDADLASLEGTGAGGRVTKRDLEDFLESARTGGAVSVGVSPTPEAPPQPAIVGPEQEIQTLAPMRKMIAEAMVRSAAVPTVSTIVQIDVTGMVRFREANKESFQAQHGVKLTYTPFFVKALTEALLQFPTVNGSLQGDQVVTHRAVHMGIAVSLGSKGDEGLIVPVLRDCHKKTLVEIAKELDSIAGKARANSLKPGDVQGGTFTLTNPGSYGALFGTPMIVAPQAAIGGAYGIQKMPVAMGDDMIAIRSMMYFALTYDHRIVDGLLAGRFLQAVKKKLETFDFFA